MAQWLYIGTGKCCRGNSPVAGRGGWYKWWRGDVVASPARCHEHYVIVVDADLFARPLKLQRMADLVIN
jgi:hypothetical protein